MAWIKKILCWIVDAFSVTLKTEKAKNLFVYMLIFAFVGSIAGYYIPFVAWYTGAAIGLVIGALK